MSCDDQIDIFSQNPNAQEMKPFILQVHSLSVGMGIHTLYH